ncbi:MAG: hypothetical protein IT555_10150 [Acetobacteraceae bacterium]|nr:hypothetical protein [Acetobacteraceae bacterium]
MSNDVALFVFDICIFYRHYFSFHFIKRGYNPRTDAELTAAQARGEIATQERKISSVRAADGASTSHADLGIPRQRAADMKSLARVAEWLARR